MIVGADPAGLIDWAVGFQQLYVSQELPRIGIHSGNALYRAAGGEVLVTRPVAERAGPHLEFERIAEVRLKGFTDSTELFLARQAEE